MPNHSNSGANIFSTALSGMIGLLLGMTIAWWTALSEKGVPRKEMEEYVKDYSPYVMERGTISEHQRVQDNAISSITSKQMDFEKRLLELEKKQ